MQRRMRGQIFPITYVRDRNGSFWGQEHCAAPRSHPENRESQAAEAAGGRKDKGAVRTSGPPQRAQIQSVQELESLGGDSGRSGAPGTRGRPKRGARAPPAEGEPTSIAPRPARPQLLSPLPPLAGGVGSPSLTWGSGPADFPGPG